MLRGLIFFGFLAVVPAAAAAQQPCTTDARRVVDELYRHMLERGADAGSSAWVTRLQSGSTVRDIVREIAKSREHEERFFNPGEGAVAHERAVATLYRHLLGRAPDAGGLQAFTNRAMTNGFDAVVDAIVDSPEYMRTFGDWVAPGSGGIRYCGDVTESSAATNTNMRYYQFDTNRDGAISRNEWRGNLRSFRVHDWNGDGVLSGDEVRVGAYPPQESLEARDYAMEPDDRFAYLDVNNNGVVDENEWDGSLVTFDRFDRNRDGRLSRAELGQTRSATSFNIIDTNSDGRLTLNEWPWSRRSFISQDVNSDGVISASEFRRNAAGATTP